MKEKRIQHFIEPVYREFGKPVADAMKSQHVIADQLASRLGVNRINIYRLVRGIHVPRLENLLPVWKELNLPDIDRLPERLARVRAEVAFKGGPNAYPEFTTGRGNDPRSKQLELDLGD